MQTTINELPNSPDAERALIGLTFIHQRIPKGAMVLSTTDFYSPLYREVWRAFLELEEDGKEIDPFAAHAVVRRNRPELASTHPVSELTNTSLGMPNTNETVFVSQIRAAAVRRFIIRELTASIAAVNTGAGGVIQDLRRKLNDLEFVEESKTAFRPLAEIIEREVKPALLDLRHGVTHKISTGFEAIDKAIGGGLSLSDVLLVAGIPGGGKSAFVLQVAVNIAKNGLPVAFLSGEMSDLENANRLISQASKQHNLNSLTHISEGDLEFFTKWADSLKALPIYFDSRTYDLRSLSLALRKMVDDHGVKVLVIDYIQLMKLNRFDKTTRTERITEASQEVKRIAMEYGIAVIEVAQFNREGAKSAKPTMHDLEGSSQLEKDTSLIFILDREESAITLRIVKGRNTGTNEIAGRFDGWRLGFDF